MPLTKTGNTYAVNYIFKNLSLALSSTEPTYDGGNVKEPAIDSGLNYERIPSSMISFGESDGYISNTGYIYFPEATGDWGTLKYYALMRSDNTVMYYGTLESEIHPTENTVVVIKPGSLKMRMN